MKKEASNCAIAIILISNVMMVISLWPAADYPQALSEPLRKTLNVDAVQISTLYTIYSIINLFTAPIGGFVANRIGVANTGLIASLLSFSGSAIAFIGIWYSNFYIMLAGRAVYSVGGETLLIVQASISERWFSGKFLSVALGLNTTFGLMVASFSNFSQPLMFAYFRDLEVPFLYMFVTGFIGFLCFAIYSIMDMKYDVKKTAEETARASKDGSSTASQDNSNFKFGDLARMGPLFWATVMIYTIVANAYYQLTFILTDFAVHRFNYPYLEAKNSLSIIQFITIFTLPCFSFISLKYGKKSILMLLATIILLATYLVLYFLEPKQTWIYYACLCSIAMFFGIYGACIWPSLALSIPKDAVSVGYGISSLSQSLLMFILPSIIGELIQENTPEEFNKALLLCIGLTACGVVLMIFVVILDFRCGGLLHYPENSELSKNAKKMIDEKFRNPVKEDKKVQERVRKDTSVSFATIGTYDRDRSSSTLGLFANPDAEN